MTTRTIYSAFDPGVMEDHQPRHVCKQSMSTLNYDSRLPVRAYQDSCTQLDNIIEVRQLSSKKSPKEPLRVDVLAVKNDKYYEVDIETLPIGYEMQRRYTQLITCEKHDVDFQVTIYPPIEISRPGLWRVLDWVPMWLMGRFLLKSKV